ncbi:pseudo histidine-containing phosphotransfer protein 1-like isoform X6 [Triticum urartu]|uniref:pseudo histidine-containing phosphotransfer protein 1-like isoform X6 n=1 Tax=Triticum urartu TaxID=4572 RepID=UPI002042D6CF|nr:pseudo histidine-containing phosphotransfer protein 1-like isoform X6 [Triticum urartu]
MKSENHAIGSLYKCMQHSGKGYLDEQFCQVEDLQDEASPNFAEEVVSLFFKDSARLVTNIEQAMEKYPKDFNRWDAHMQQLRGSCFSCRRTFQKVKREHAILRQKLESYFQLLRQAGPARAATRPGSM